MKRKRKPIVKMRTFSSSMKSVIEKESKILLVDDQGYNRTALKIILKHHAKVDVENICDEAGNGKEALHAVLKNVASNNFEKCSYKLILMDCNMPIMDGYQATKKIRSFLKTLNLDQP